MNKDDLDAPSWTEEDQEGTTTSDRARCRICGKHPKLTKGGALRHHTYPWYHSQNGQPCPGSGHQVTPLAGQLDMEALCEDTPSD